MTDDLAGNGVPNLGTFWTSEGKQNWLVLARETPARVQIVGLGRLELLKLKIVPEPAEVRIMIGPEQGGLQ